MKSRLTIPSHNIHETSSEPGGMTQQRQPLSLGWHPIHTLSCSLEFCLSNRLLALAILCFMAGSGCTTPGMHRAAQQNVQAPNTWPKLLSVYMPWFGDRSHMDVGYSSNDPAMFRRQIQQARRMGISAFVVDWYGNEAPFSDRNFALMEQAADESRFQVALLYNESNDDSGQA